MEKLWIYKPILNERTNVVNISRNISALPLNFKAYLTKAGSIS